MIFRLILLFLIIWFLIWMIRKQITDKNQPKPRIKDSSSEDMVICDYCGTHVPESLSLKSEGMNYCCQEHLKLDESDR